jgi:hypothetical protein
VPLLVFAPDFASMLVSSISWRGAANRRIVRLRRSTTPFARLLLGTASLVALQDKQSPRPFNNS